MATVADYADAVDRILTTDVSADSTSEAEILNDLRGADAPQVTAEVARNLVDSVVTEESVREAIESTGEVPSEAEIDAIAGAVDDYDMSDRVDAVADAVEEQVATREEISEAVQQRADQSDEVYREQVEAAVGSVEESGKEVVGADRESVITEQARDVGAPAESDVQTARAEATAPDESVKPSNREDLSSDSKTPVNIIQDESGEAVGAFGGASQGGVSPEETAEELGVEYLGSVSDIADSFEISGSGETVDLTLDGQTVGEVDVR